MSVETIINVDAFAPWEGGDGVTTDVSTTGVTVKIPGLEGGTPDYPSRRVLVTNDGPMTVHAKMGQSTITPSIQHMKILPGCAYLLRPPYVGPQEVWISLITKFGSANVNVCSGTGV